jgi:hypothetical protein
MRGVSKPALALAAALLLATGLGACGGGDSDGSTAATTQESTAGATAEQQGSGGSPSDAGSASFRTPGGDNSIQSFGEEADAAEVDAVSAVLAGYLRARAKDDWPGQCDYLALATLAPLEALASGSSQFKGKGCAAILKALTSGAPGSTRANTLTGGVASLRFKGDRGFALYHGAQGIDYFMLMTKEDGEWKAGALAPSEFP